MSMTAAENIAVLNTAIEEHEAKRDELYETAARNRQHPQKWTRLAFNGAVAEDMIPDVELGLAALRSVRDELAGFTESDPLVDPCAECGATAWTVVDNRALCPRHAWR